jgi:flagellar protein FlbD
MIELTRLNGQAMVVNCDLIKYVESSPDTMLTLIHGEKIVVSEPCQEVVRRISAYRLMLLVNVFSQLSTAGAADLANVAGGAAGLRALAAEQAMHAGEVPDGVDDAAQLRRRRKEI